MINYTDNQRHPLIDEDYPHPEQTLKDLLARRFTSQNDPELTKVLAEITYLRDLLDQMRDSWGTPSALASSLVCGFDLRRDVCAHRTTAKCDLFYDASDDGLAKKWEEDAWCNPPYSDILPWAEKALNEDVRTLFLLPARTVSPWFRLLTASSRCTWWTFNGRISFVPPLGVEASSPRHDSLLIHIGLPSIPGAGYAGVLSRILGVQL